MTLDRLLFISAAVVFLCGWYCCVQALLRFLRRNKGKRVGWLVHVWPFVFFIRRNHDTEGWRYLSFSVICMAVAVPCFFLIITLVPTG